ncbi:hypothetical protein NKH41_32735, partial [Mesorhizobium sp. M1169]|uniref:hypothetical protein n=1 Tax=Mesorhizobium sp. M1169 TaxID=2957066 RepID=UPI00333D66E3
AEGGGYPLSAFLSDPFGAESHKTSNSRKNRETVFRPELRQNKKDGAVQRFRETMTRSRRIWSQPQTLSRFISCRRPGESSG